MGLQQIGRCFEEQPVCKQGLNNMVENERPRAQAPNAHAQDNSPEKDWLRSSHEGEGFLLSAPTPAIRPPPSCHWWPTGGSGGSSAPSSTRKQGFSLPHCPEISFLDITGGNGC